jgi:hypothetical protein
VTSKANSARATWFVAAFALLGCGDDGLSVKQKCEKIIDTVCDRFMECAELAGGFASDSQRKASRAQCEANFATEARCDAVIEVGDTYDECLDVLADEQCSALIAEDENSTYETPQVCKVLEWRDR